MLNLSDVLQIVNARNELWHAGNEAGDGYAPVDFAALDLAHEARSTDDVDVFVDYAGGYAVLVGDANGPWAVRVAVAS